MPEQMNRIDRTTDELYDVVCMLEIFIGMTDDFFSPKRVEASVLTKFMQNRRKLGALLNQANTVLRTAQRTLELACDEMMSEVPHE